jgi:hypothetical protein
MNDVTANKLTEMFTENTGRDLLDSGGAYGRAWERNQGKTTADFLAQPVAGVDDDGCIWLDMYHYLNERLTYCEELDSAWVAFDAKHPDISWGESLEIFLDMLGVDEDGDFYSDARWSFNSYNSENLLNGTFQGTKFGLNGSWYFALQIHGGCDVRGGYTKPAIFTMDDEGLFLDLDRAYLCCPECDFRADFYEGSLQCVEMPIIPASPQMLIEVDADTELPKGWEPKDGCPIHHVALIA